MTPNNAKMMILSAAAGLLFASANTALAQEQQTSQQRRRAPVAARAQEGGLIGNLPGQPTRSQQGAAPDAGVLPAAPTLDPTVDPLNPALEPEAPNPEAGALEPEARVLDPKAPVEIDMPLGDSIERPAQMVPARVAGQTRGQTGQRGQRGEAPIEMPGLEPAAPLAPDSDPDFTAIDDETSVPGDLDTADMPEAAVLGEESQQDGSSAQATAPAEKKPGFFRRMWTKIKSGARWTANGVKNLFTRDKKPETAAPAAPSDAPLTDIDLGGGPSGDAGSSD